MKNLYKKGFSPVIIIIVVLILVAVGLYFYTAPKQGNEVKNEINNNSSEPVGFEENPNNLNIPVVTEEPIIGAEVGMKGFAFGPATVTIKVGQSVEWVNDDTANHTVTSDTGLFDSGNEAPGNSYTRKFDQPGTYTYFCKWHPNMKGTVIVTQ